MCPPSLPEYVMAINTLPTYVQYVICLHTGKLEHIQIQLVMGIFKFDSTKKSSSQTFLSWLLQLTYKNTFSLSFSVFRSHLFSAPPALSIQNLIRGVKQGEGVPIPPLRELPGFFALKTYYRPFIIFPRRGTGTLPPFDGAPPPLIFMLCPWNNGLRFLKNTLL